MNEKNTEKSDSAPSHFYRGRPSVSPGRDWRTLINQQPDLAVCGQAEDAAQALAGIGASHAQLALIDISLKTASGLELVKDLKIHHPDVALIVLSMHDEMLYAERAIRAGARGYVMKRESTKEVLTAIRRVLQGDVYVSERVVNLMARRLGSPAKPPPIRRSNNSAIASWKSFVCSDRVAPLRRSPPICI